MEHLATIEIYVTPRGRKPFVEWLHRIEDVKSRAVIRAWLNRIRLGNFGDCHSVGDDVHEFRIDYGPGYRTWHDCDANYSCHWRRFFGGGRT